jgi:hypothetical protein
MGWFNHSVKNYTSVVEVKLLKLFEDCLERQETLERKLNEYEITFLNIDKNYVITIERDEDMQNEQEGPLEYYSNDSSEIRINQKRKYVKIKLNL